MNPDNEVTPSRGKIAAALAKAQAKIENPVYDREVTGSFSYSYATLAQILDIVRPALTEQGIALVQSPRVEPLVVEAGANVNAHKWMAFVTTEFIHESGESVGCDVGIPFNGGPQQAGGAITYARRYGLTALMGIAADNDDDATDIQGNREKLEIKPVPARSTTKDVPPPKDRLRFIRLANLAVEQGVLSAKDIQTGEAIWSTVAELFGVPRNMFDPNKMTPDKWTEACQRLITQTGVKPTVNA